METIRKNLIAVLGQFIHSHLEEWLFVRVIHKTEGDKNMEREQLELILREHYKWLSSRFTDTAQGKYADLSGADLCGADLSFANLKSAILCGADLRNADLSGADLRGANLIGANLTNIKFNEDTSFLTLQCPKKGSFIGWKKASDLIVELEIPTTAKRSSATTRQCRCSEAKVLSITNLDGSCCEINSVVSSYDKNFIYTVGETVKVADFDEDRWNECAPGIHFFITREEAVTY